MLAWRGMFGTTVVHSLAIVGWPVIGFELTSYCLCAMPAQDDVATFTQVEQRRLAVFAALLPGDQPAVPSMEPTCTGSRPFAAAPSILEVSALPRAMARGGPLAFCAKVDARGDVTALRVVQAGGRSRAMLDRIRKRVEAIRFAPAKLNGRPIDTEVEFRLIA